MHRDEKGWIEAYQKKGALWIHSGAPSAPHVELTSGLHSDGFFNSRLVTGDEELLEEAAFDLVSLFVERYSKLNFNGVVGPQTGATKLAEVLALTMQGLTGENFFSASPAKCMIDGQKSMEFSQKELFNILGSRVLLCEDVCTTGGSVELAAQAVARASGFTTPYVLVLVNRSGSKYINGRHVVALIDRAMTNWESANCPLCKGGSKALRAKDNWAELMAG